MSIDQRVTVARRSGSSILTSPISHRRHKSESITRSSCARSMLQPIPCVQSILSSHDTALEIGLGVAARRDLEAEIVTTDISV